MIRTRILAIVVASIVWAEQPARGDVVYIASSNDNLATLNPTTGTITPIGQTSITLDGIGFSASGQLYGLGSDANIYKVNTSTAALTLVGATNMSFSGGATLGASSNGTLYAVNGVGNIGTVNPNTGAATPLGNIGFTINSNPSGNGGSGLYEIGNGNLYSINPATGAGTLIGAGSYNTVIYALTYADGTMYAMEANGSSPGIYSVNLATGNSTLVSNYNPSVVGDVYAAATLTTASVPEPTSLVLVICVAALCGLGQALRRRTKLAGSSV